MALRAGQNDAVVVGDAGDPLRFKTLTLKQVFEAGGIERHDQNIRDLVAHKDRHLDIGDGFTGHRTDDQFGNLPLPAGDDPLRRLRIRDWRQRGAKFGAGIEELPLALVDQRYTSAITPQRVSRLFVTAGIVGSRTGAGGGERLKDDVARSSSRSTSSAKSWATCMTLRSISASSKLAMRCKAMAVSARRGNVSASANRLRNVRMR